MARSYLPPGFRFHPTDEELLVHYLKKKVAGKIQQDSIIGEVEIYKFEPSDLPGLAVLRSRDPEWFFFNALDRKYNGSRTNRTTKAGYWKATGKDRRVAVGSCTGMKKTLIYYVGRAPHGERTDWVMHEYRLDEEVERSLNSLNSFVLCRVRRKSGLGPRNGEQYGAPVLEEEVENTEGTNEVDEVPVVIPSALPKPMTEGTVQGTPSVSTVNDSARIDRGGNFESFLQDLLAFDEPEQHQSQEGDFVANGLLSLLDDESDLSLVNSTHETAPTNTFDINPSNLSNLIGLSHPMDNEAIVLEDILHMVTGMEGIPEHPSGMQEHYRHHSSVQPNDLQRVGFLELADLDGPCDDPSSVESAEFVSLLTEMQHDLECPSSSDFILDQLQIQQSLPPSSDREGVRGVQHPEDSFMNNELEVQLGSSQSLSVVHSLGNRSVEVDGVVPSGFALSSDREGVVGNHSHSNGSYGKPEAQLEEVDNHIEIRNSLNEEHVNRSTHSVVPPNEHSNTPVHTASSPSSPSSFARLISGFLGKVNTLPASAAELPSELKRSKHSEKESFLCSTVERKAGESLITAINGTSLNLTLKLNPLQDEKQSAVSDLKLQWTALSSTLLDGGCMQNCKGASNGFSRQFFWMATIALIVFCSLRGFCRYMRVAFT